MQATSQSYTAKYPDEVTRENIVRVLLYLSSIENRYSFFFVQDMRPKRSLRENPYMRLRACDFYLEIYILF